MQDVQDRSEDRLLYSIKSAAQAVDVSYKTMHRMVTKRVIGHVLVPMGTPGHLSRRIRREDIDEWVGRGIPRPPV